MARTPHLPRFSRPQMRAIATILMFLVFLLATAACGSKNPTAPTPTPPERFGVPRPDLCPCWTP